MIKNYLLIFYNYLIQKSHYFKKTKKKVSFLQNDNLNKYYNYNYDNDDDEYYNYINLNYAYYNRKNDYNINNDIKNDINNNDNNNDNHNNKYQYFNGEDLRSIIYEEDYGYFIFIE